MKIMFRWAVLIAVILALVSFASAQSPTIEKVEPPNWWANHSINPVRVMIRGSNLKGATVQSNSKDLKTANIKTSDNGHYLFADVTINKNARVGKYNLKIQTTNGTVNAPFEISAPIARQGHYQGFTPDDVIYFLMPDRFADGDMANNDPAKSKGLYDRAKGRFYHGGDLQGVINHLDYIKSLGATAIWTTPVYDNNDKPDYKEVYKDENGAEQPSTGYHGYGATDFYAIDEHLGDMAKLREFIEKAHAQGLKVIQDQIANHTGPYH
ncbi:MAG: alpha-amylase family glycosyl hydrolase, partial [Pyrinomonadaceae bacterium]